jgi:hypothetical protein
LRSFLELLFDWKRNPYLAQAVQTGYHGSGIGVGGKFILQGPVGLPRLFLLGVETGTERVHEEA